jgi:hypothetical protein
MGYYAKDWGQGLKRIKMARSLVNDQWCGLENDRTLLYYSVRYVWTISTPVDGKIQRSGGGKK